VQLAEAGPAVPAELGDFYAQRPQWSEPDEGGMQRARIEVPLDYASPGGPRIEIALSRIPSASPGRRSILLSVQGDPGGGSGQGCELVRVLHRAGLGQAYDLIGFDPRGTGGSTQLTAPTVIPKAGFDSRPPDSAFAQIAEDMRRREEACASGGGEMRQHISTRNTARDMDIIRGVLGEPSLSFVGYAYGSYVAAVYGTMFPSRLDRSVLDSAVHPDWTWREVFLGQAEAIRGNVDTWAQWAGERPGALGLGDSAAAVLAAIEEVAARLEGIGPAGTFLRTLFDGAMGARTADRSQWAELARIIGELRGPAGEDPDAAGELLGAQRTWRPQDTEGQVRNAALEAVTLETYWPGDLEVYYRDMRRAREFCPYGYGVTRAMPWVGAFRSFTAPEPPTKLVRDGYPAGLVVQADSDAMDPYAGGVAMARRLGHRLVTIADSGDHEVYALLGNPHVDAVVNRYLIDGILPDGDVTCPAMVARPDIPAGP
jgi:pimeloyl-ACP methyl ester carboxylesterase